MDERKTLAFRLDAEHAEHLERRAREEDCSMSRILRQLVSKDYERDKRRREREEQVAAG